MSSSFVTIHLKSKVVAAFFEENKDEIEAANDGYCDVNITVEGDCVSVEMGDTDAFLLDVPDGTDSAVSMLISLCGIGPIDRASKTELADSIEEIEWSAEQWGLDCDDGRFDKSNYDPDVLS